MYEVDLVHHLLLHNNRWQQRQQNVIEVLDERMKRHDVIKV
jgi:hypothetical protein